MTDEFATTVTLDGFPCVMPSPADAGGAAALANSFWCPLGAQSGRGWALVLRSDLKQIHAQGSAYHELRFTTGHGGRRQELALGKLLLVGSTRITRGPAGSAEALHLVELADRRWLAERFSDTGKLAFNLRAAASAADYLDGTDGHTWESVVQSLWDRMTDVLGPFPGLPAELAPHGTPENLTFVGTSAWRALSEVLSKLGAAVRYDPIDDAVDLVALGAEQSDVPAALTDDCSLLFDGEPFAPPAAHVPQTIRVYFHSHYRSFGQQRDVEVTDNYLAGAHSTFVDVPTQEPAAVPGTILPLWDDLARVLDEDNVEANSAALADRAAVRAARWLADRSNSAQRPAAVAGIVPGVRCGPQIKAVRWQAAGPLAGGSRTEVTSGPGMPRLSDLSLYDAEFGGARSPPGRENYAPPAIARPGFPAIPQLAQGVEVDDGASATGALLTANGDGLFPGVVIRYVAGGIVPLEACWIRPVDLEAGDSPSQSSVVALRQGDRLLGRLSGLETSAGQTRPVYLVRRGISEDTAILVAADTGAPQTVGDGGTITFTGTDGVITSVTAGPTVTHAPAGPIELVELGATLSPGSSATATVLQWDGDSYEATGASITVHDAFALNFGLSAERLSARRHPGSSRWEVIGASGLTRRGTADETITAGSSGTVNIITGSGDADTGVNVTAHLAWMEGADDVSSGKELIVQWFPDTSRWYITHAECE